MALTLTKNAEEPDAGDKLEPSRSSQGYSPDLAPEQCGPLTPTVSGQLLLLPCGKTDSPVSLLLTLLDLHSGNWGRGHFYYTPALVVRRGLDFLASVFETVQIFEELRGQVVVKDALLLLIPHPSWCTAPLLSNTFILRVKVSLLQEFRAILGPSAPFSLPLARIWLPGSLPLLILNSPHLAPSFKC